jgi:hypothetical protein
VSTDPGLISAHWLVDKSNSHISLYSI